MIRSLKYRAEHIVSEATDIISETNHINNALRASDFTDLAVKPSKIVNPPNPKLDGPKNLSQRHLREIKPSVPQT